MNILPVMKSVETVLQSVYGGKLQAAERFGLVKTAPFNWLKTGHFPARLVPQIVADAEAVGVDISAADVPILKIDHAKKRARKKRVTQ